MMKTTNEIEQGHSQMQDVLNKTVLNRTEIQSAKSKIEIGLERKRKCESQISVLERKRKTL